MKIIHKLTPKIIAIIERWLEEPTLTQKEMAEEFGCTTGWMGQIANSPIFKEEMERRCKAVWRDSVKIAVKTLKNAAAQGSESAAKYILDTNGYAPKQQIELENKVINITLDD